MLIRKEERSADILYFGYGSNLDREDWKSFCERHGYDPDGLTSIEPAVLPDHELSFGYRSASRGGGALDLRPRRGHAVPGMVFHATIPGLRGLDAKEGAPRYYERVPITALRHDGTPVAAQTYRVRAERTARDHVAPTPAYCEVVRRGYAAYGLDTGMLEAAIANEPPMFLAPSVFVYGSLMRGESRFSALTDNGSLRSVLLSRAPGRLYSLGAFPAMSPDMSGRNWVEGELVTFDDPGQVLEALDRIEGFRGFGEAGSLFRRTLVTVELDGRLRRAWTYVIDRLPAGAEPIPSGDWRKACRRKERFVRALVAAHADRNPDFLRHLEIELTPPAALPDPDHVRTTEDLVGDLLIGAVSERRISRASDCWTVVPDRNAADIREEC